MKFGTNAWPRFMPFGLEDGRPLRMISRRVMLAVAHLRVSSAKAILGLIQVEELVSNPMSYRGRWCEMRPIEPLRLSYGTSQKPVLARMSANLFTRPASSSPNVAPGGAGLISVISDVYRHLGDFHGTCLQRPHRRNGSLVAPHLCAGRAWAVSYLRSNWGPHPTWTMPSPCRFQAWV